MPHPAEPANEILQCYDEAGNPTEGRPRSEVKQLPYRWWYGVAKIWVVNTQGQLLCPRRSMSVVADPGKWQTHFGGHVQVGHSFLETAVRELQEEADIELPTTAFSLIERTQDIERKVFSENYVIRYDGGISDLHFPDGEVAEARWIDLENLTSDKRDPNEWCNTLKPHQQDKIKAWLVSSK